jgi:hypothetical protein
MKNGIKKIRKLGRFSGVFAVCIAMIMTAAGTAVGMSLNHENQTPLFLLNQMEYSFTFSQPVIQTISNANGAFATLSMSGCPAIGKQAGDPSMPVKVVQLLLPPNKAVSSITVSGTPVKITPVGINLVEKPIFPQQQSVPIGSDERPEFVMNNDIYSSNALYPEATYSDYAIGYSHGYAILSLNLNPMQYNPKQGVLYYYPEMTMTITLQNEMNLNQFFRNNPDDEAYVKSFVSNPSIANYYETLGGPTFEYPGGLCDPSDHYDYVIITTTKNNLDYWETSNSTPYNWESLMQKHASDDALSCTLVTVQDIDACDDYHGSAPFNDQQAHIREFSKDAYADWGTSYILIGADGETGYIPARDMDTNYEGDIDADIYWSNLDSNFNSDSDSSWGEEGDSGFDLYADLYIGRVTCDEPQDVSNWLTKSFCYADSIDFEYLNNAGFYGGDTGWNCQGDDFMDYSAIKGTDDWLGPIPHNDGPFPAWAGFQYGFETWNAVNPNNVFDISNAWTAEPPNPGWQGGSESAAINGFKNAINNDLITIASGIAHANPEMSLDVYDSEWESQYHNTKPFFLHDYGCHCGDFDDSDEGVLHSMLFHSDTELAFGVVYNTCYGWGNLDSTNSSSAFQAKEFWSYFLDLENKSGDYGNWRLGMGHAYSKDRMAPTIGWDYSYGTWRAIIQGCLLFGDPAQLIKPSSPSDPPAPPSKPEGKTLGCWNEQYTYTSSTTDPNGDQIYYLFDWDDGTTSGWLGPYNSGQTGTGSHIWTKLGNFSVVVRARDVWGAGSMPSEPLMVTITDNLPPTEPSISGTTQVKRNVPYDYTFVATDPFGQDVFFDIDWGDGNGAAALGPYHSGEEAVFTHTWKINGPFTIKARAQDTVGAYSEWVTLGVTKPTVYQSPLLNLLEHLFERFPNIFPILRHLMGY